MVRLSTIYDKDLKKKVFVVRGDESYAKSTECEVVVGNITTDDIKGLKISTLTINLYRTVGNGQLTLYDDDIPLESWNISSSVHSKTLTNYYLGYNANHNLWAEYTPLDHQCLGCKSKKVTVFEEIPSSLLINYTKNSASSQVNSGADISFNYTVKKGTTNVANNTPVLVYVDDDYVKTVNTSSGKVASTISDISDGRHTIKLEVNTSDTFYGNSIEYDVLVGYQVEIVSYPQIFINTTSNEVVAKIIDYNGEPVNEGVANVYKKNSSSSLGSATVSDGSSIIPVRSIPSTGEYCVAYGGSVSECKIFTLYSPSGLTITADSLLTGIGKSIKITATLSDPIDDVPIITQIANQKHIDYSKGGVSITSYTGKGLGNLTTTVSVADINESVQITDSYMYWKSNSNHTNNTDSLMDSGEGSIVEYSNYICLRDIAKTTGSTSGISYGSITFEVPDYPSAVGGDTWLMDRKSLEFTIARKPSNVIDLEFSYLPYVTIYDVDKGQTVSSLKIPSSKLNIGSVIKFTDSQLKVDNEVLYNFQLRISEINYYIPVLKYNTQNGGELYIKDLIYKKV